MTGRVVGSPRSAVHPATLGHTSESCSPYRPSVSRCRSRGFPSMDVQTDAGVDAALWGLDAAFVAHPIPETLVGCPHCHGDVRVADADPLTLALAVGNTLGTPEDLRALTPWLLRRALTDDRVDLRTVLGRVAENWADWSDPERDAVRDLVDAVWSALLDTHPDALEGATAVAMLDGLAALGEPPERFLAIWEYKE